MSTTNEGIAPIITRWGDYEIAVRIGAGTSRQPAGGVTASYEIYKRDRLIAASRAQATYPSASIARESALLIAKLDARESLDGMFSSY